MGVVSCGVALLVWGVSWLVAVGGGSGFWDGGSGFWDGGSGFWTAGAGSGTAGVVSAGAISDFLDVGVVLFAVSAENHLRRVVGLIVGSVGWGIRHERPDGEAIPRQSEASGPMPLRPA